jgi:hypothetical protein
VTHYVSDAECGAIALMTGLTSLRLGGHHGWRRGGLASLSTLTALRALTLLDNGRSANSGDAAALAGLPHLTQLRVGFCPGLVAALLPALADAAPHRASPPQQPQQQQPQQQWAGPAGPSSPSALNPAAQPGRPDAAASSSCSSGGSTSRPVLRSLELSVSHPDVWWSEPELRSIAAGWHLPTVWRLSGLTRLVIGGLLEEVPGGWQGPGLPLACQRGVSALVGLVELVLDWAVPEELLPSLEALSGEAARGMEGGNRGSGQGKVCLRRCPVRVHSIVFLATVLHLPLRFGRSSRHFFDPSPPPPHLLCMGPLSQP